MATTRREFLGITVSAGVGALVPWRFERMSMQVAHAAAPAAGVVATPPLAKFVTTPIIPPKIAPVAGSTVEMPLHAGSHVFHPALPPTPTWGYGPMPVLGPTIEARLNEPFTVHWQNNLPGTHLLQAAIDPMVHGADPATYPPVRIVTHLHGGHVPHTVDGGPEAWYVNPLTVPLAPNGQPYDPNPKSHGEYYTYPNQQGRATTLWYHDHALGITRLNVYAGLAGFYLLRDAAEDSLNLPSGDFEIPLAIQDRTFLPTGDLYYPPPPHVPEFFGDTMVVNGQVWPRLVVYNRKYRFRLLNGCNARFLRMQLIQAGRDGLIPATPAQWVPGPAFDQIGTDGGLLDATATMPVLTMAPGERCDVILDFTNFLRKPTRNNPNGINYFLLYNDAQTPFSNAKGSMGAIPDVMLFEVRPMPAGMTDTSSALTPGNRVERLLEANATVTRNVTLDEVVDANGNLMALLNNMLFMDPATELPRIGVTEVWNIINLTPDTHPIHLHQTMFQLLDRRPFNPRDYMRANTPGAPIDPTPYYTGAILPPDANEVGWKDTIRANPAEVTRIIVRWEGYTGEYVWHCHILEHEDHEMMRPLLVQPAIV